MDADGLTFSSHQFLRLIEGEGLVGTWKWNIADDQYSGSSSYHRVLGLDLQTTRLSYNVFHDLVHPEDQGFLSSCVEMIQHAGGYTSGMLRIVRPDQSIRILSARRELVCLPDGRPVGMAGAILDVTDQETLVRARALELCRQQALFTEL